RPRARGDEGIHHPARPLVPWADADPAVAFGPAVARPAEPAAPLRVDRRLPLLVRQLPVQAALLAGTHCLLVHRHDAWHHTRWRGRQSFLALLRRRHDNA